MERDRSGAGDEVAAATIDEQRLQVRKARDECPEVLGRVGAVLVVLGPEWLERPLGPGPLPQVRSLLGREGMEPRRRALG